MSLVMIVHGNVVQANGFTALSTALAGLPGFYEWGGLPKMSARQSPVSSLVHRHRQIVPYVGGTNDRNSLAGQRRGQTDQVEGDGVLIKGTGRAGPKVSLRGCCQSEVGRSSPLASEGQLFNPFHEHSTIAPPTATTPFESDLVSAWWRKHNPALLWSSGAWWRLKRTLRCSSASVYGVLCGRVVPRRFTGGGLTVLLSLASVHRSSGVWISPAAPRDRS
jgi:hypothetical protein